jgi:hypothetical protein
MNLTYGLPVWSSFRAPFKFLIFFLASLALAGGVGLEICWRQAGADRSLFRLGLGLAGLAGLLLVFDVRLMDYFGQRVVSVYTGSGLLCLITGLVLMPLTPLARPAWARRLLFVVVPLQLFGMAVLSQQTAYRAYRAPYAAVGPTQLGIDNRYRVLPLSRYHFEPDVPAEEYGLFHAATANGYYSATGHNPPNLQPAWYLRWLPSDMFGLLPYEANEKLLGSHLLRSFNVRYVLVGKRDEAHRRLVADKQAYQPVNELKEVLVYEDALALPRAYFAGELRPFSDEGLYDGLVLNHAPRTTAYVEGLDQPVGRLGGEVTGQAWDREVVRLRVLAPEGGFLVVSMTYYPDWSVWIDGVPTEVNRINGTIMGVAVPPGAREVLFRYSTPGVAEGALAAGAGVLALLFWYALTRRVPRAER